MESDNEIQRTRQAQLKELLVCVYWKRGVVILWGFI
jgi:hypothetical protein